MTLAVAVDPSGTDWTEPLMASVGDGGAAVRIGAFALASDTGIDRQNPCEALALAGEFYGEPRPTVDWARRDPDELAGTMGAFVVAAIADDRLTLVRDQLGEQCLYVWQRGRLLLGASDIRVLMRLLPRRPAPDKDTVAAWLRATAIPGDRTFHHGVRRLPPGSMMVVDGSGRAVIRRWWSARYAEPAPIPFDEAVARVRAAVLQAVERRNGGRVALMLSGGLDSASIAGTQARALGRPPTAYSLRFPDYQGLDETGLIEDVRRESRLSGPVLRVDRGSVLRGLVVETKRWGVPVLSPNVFYQSTLTARMREDGMDALVDGEGGDELFSPARFLLADLVGAGRIRQSWIMTRRFPGASAASGRLAVWRFWRQHGAAGVVPAGFLQAYRRSRRRNEPPLLRPDVEFQVDPLDHEQDWRALDGPRWWRYLAWANTVNYETLGAHEHFRHRAEGAGLSSRHPFRDVALLELVLQLPPELAWDPRLDRPLLRKAVAGLVPPSVLQRGSKARFDALYVNNVVAEGRIFRRLIGRSDAAVRAYVSSEGLDRRLLLVEPRAHHRGLAGWTEDAFRLAVMEIWLRSEQDADLPRRLLRGEPLLDLDVTFDP